MNSFGRSSILVVATTFASGPLWAQTSVTLYGVADGGLRFDHTNIGTLKAVSSGGGAGSRWGLRGVEDLGGGLQANFVFEQGVDIGDSGVPQGNITGATPTSNASSSGGRIFSRISTVGLSGGFGSVRFGRDYKPTFSTIAQYEPFGAGYVATAVNIAIKLVPRYDNAVFYGTPRIAGFQATVVRAFGEATTDTRPGTPKNAGSRTGFGASYVADGFTAAYGYSNEVAATTSTLLSNRPNRTRINDASFGYDFEVVKLSLIGWFVKDDVGFNMRNTFVGATVPYGAFTFLAGIGHIDDRGSSVPATASAKTNYDANFFGGTATYSLSKRTTLYTAYSKFTVHNGGVYPITDANAPTPGLFTTTNLMGINPWSAQIGVTHRF